MFRKIETKQQTITMTFDGIAIDVDADQTVAAVLLSQGISTFRTSVVSNSPRGPYCLMGVCFECLVTINGVQNRQACMTPVREHMSILSQRGARSLEEGC